MPTATTLDPTHRRAFEQITSAERRAAVTDHAAAVATLTDTELRTQVAVDVLDAAIAGDTALELRLALSYDDACRRAELAGRDPHCGRHNLYAQGWADAYRSQGHHPERTCTCTTATPTAGG